MKKVLTLLVTLLPLFCFGQAAGDFRIPVWNVGGTTLTNTNFTPPGLRLAISLGNVEDIALSTWTGSTSITTLGTITTGTVPLARLADGTQGDIMYFDGTDWVVLPAGTAGYLLATQGAGANPGWGAFSLGGNGSGDNARVVKFGTSGQLTAASFNAKLSTSATRIGQLNRDSITFYDVGASGFSYSISPPTPGADISITLPSASGTLIGTGDTGTVTNAMLAGSITDTKLDTISTGGKVSNSATTATSASTNGAIVARDGSGNFSAGTITANVTGIASGNEVPLTFSQSVSRSTNTITLNGDSASPGNSKLYGTDGSGTKGWYAQPAGTTYTGTAGQITVTGSVLSIPNPLVIPAINGGTAANDDIIINGTSSATKTTSYVVLQDTGGNVGIGVTAPSERLVVGADFGDVSPGTFAVVGDSAANSGFAAGQGANNNFAFRWVYNATAGSASARLNTSAYANPIYLDGSALFLQTQNVAATTIGGTLTVTGASTLTGGIVGVITVSNATAGNVGQLISSSVVQGSALALTTATPLSVTSISLTAGDWDVSCVGSLTGASTGTVFDVAIGTTNNSFTGTVLGDTRCQSPTVSLTGADASMTIPSVRVNVSATTTYYLIISETFTIGTPAAYGRISARRVR